MNRNIVGLVDSVKHLCVDEDGLVEGLREYKRQRLVAHLEQRYRNQGMPVIDQLIEDVLESKKDKKKSVAAKAIDAVAPLRSKNAKKEESGSTVQSKESEEGGSKKRVRKSANRSQPVSDQSNANQA